LCQIYGDFEIPAASLSTFDTVAIIVLVPVFDRGIYPFLTRYGMTHLNCLSFALFFCFRFPFSVRVWHFSLPLPFWCVRLAFFCFCFRFFCSFFFYFFSPLSFSPSTFLSFSCLCLSFSASASPCLLASNSGFVLGSGFKLSMLRRMGAGLLVAALAMVTAAVVETYRLEVQDRSHASYTVLLYVA
jgi:hypothetical protein